jgi:hypothetical protein
MLVTRVDGTSGRVVEVAGNNGFHLVPGVGYHYYTNTSFQLSVECVNIFDDIPFFQNVNQPHTSLALTVNNNINLVGKKIPEGTRFNSGDSSIGVLEVSSVDVDGYVHSITGGTAGDTFLRTGIGYHVKLNSEEKHFSIATP